MTQTQPGWYPDPGGLPVLRWWEGQWTSAVMPAPRPVRRPFLWRLVWAPFAVGMAVFVLLPIHESLLGSDVSCGGAFSALGRAPTQAAIDAGFGDVAQGVADECKSDGQTHLLLGGGFLVAGVVAAGVTRKWERERA